LPLKPYQNQGTTGSLRPVAAERIIQSALGENRRALLEPEAKEVCRAYQMPIPDFGVAHSESEAAKLAEEVAFPVVLKIVSRDILHKSEAGGLLLELDSREQVEIGYRQIIDNVRAYDGNARIEGVLVQHMAPNGIEVIVGGLRDSQFGATVLFGLGGIFVEVLKDVTFRVAPLDELDAQEMIKEIHSYPILRGVRGQQAAIARILHGTSRIMLDNSCVEQMDLNPVMVYGSGASVVDARIIIHGSEPVQL
jgi:succinyl-CoA synthetase beta subunit